MRSMKRDYIGTLVEDVKDWTNRGYSLKTGILSVFNTLHISDEVRPNLENEIRARIAQEKNPDILMGLSEKEIRKILVNADW